MIINGVELPFKLDFQKFCPLKGGSFSPRCFKEVSVSATKTRRVRLHLVINEKSQFNCNECIIGAHALNANVQCKLNSFIRTLSNE